MTWKKEITFFQIYWFLDLWKIGLAELSTDRIPIDGCYSVLWLDN